MDYEELCNKYFKIAVENGYAEKGDDKRVVAAEMISRAKTKKALAAKFGITAETAVTYTNYKTEYDMQYEGKKIETKARRGRYDKKYFEKNRAMMPLRKVKDCDWFVTVTSDGYGICWDSTAYTSTGITTMERTNDMDDKRARVEPYAFFDISNCNWQIKFDYDRFVKIDNIIQHKNERRGQSLQ